MNSNRVAVAAARLDQTPDTAAAMSGVAPAWHAYAACQNLSPDLFFLDRNSSVKEAKRVCAGCAVRETCLEHALTKPERHGIWGGLSQKQRIPLRRARMRALRVVQ